MAPLTRNRAHGDGTPKDRSSDYQQRASAGLIITEATQVSPEGKGYLDTRNLQREAQKCLQEIVRSVHERSGKIFLQLWHVGRIVIHLYKKQGKRLWLLQRSKRIVKPLLQKVSKMFPSHKRSRN